MHNNTRSHASIFGISWSAANAALPLLLTLLFLIFPFLFLPLTPQPAQGQTYRVIHNFTGGTDGGSPAAGLTMDQNGNLYGTTLTGGHAQLRPEACNWMRYGFQTFEERIRLVLVGTPQFRGDGRGGPIGKGNFWTRWRPVWNHFRRRRLSRGVHH